ATRPCRGTGSHRHPCLVPSFPPMVWSAASRIRARGVNKKGPREGALCCRVMRPESLCFDEPQMPRHGALLPVRQKPVLDALSGDEIIHSCRLNGGDVDKHITPASLGNNEPVVFRPAKPLHRAGMRAACH